MLVVMDRGEDVEWNCVHRNYISVVRKCLGEKLGTDTYLYEVKKILHTPILIRSKKNIFWSEWERKIMKK